MAANANVVDLNREISLGLLKSSTGYAVRTPRGQKDPGHLGWDPKTNDPERSRKTIFELEKSNDNLGIHLFGSIVDVDVDTDNPFMTPALDYFLPHTSHVWGRASRPRSHRLYELVGVDNQFSPADFPFLRVLKSTPAISVEIRGGEAKSGQYSLLPGSIHPSGEAYEWHDIRAARTTPVAVDIDRVVNGIRFACVASLIAPYWTEGVRNALCMALSGFFYKCAQHIADMGSAGRVYFEKHDAEHLLEGIMKVAGDDPADAAMRKRTFEDTWDKGDSGAPIQGGTTLVKLTGDEALLSLLYILLVDSPDMVVFDEFLDRYAVRNGTSTIIDRYRAGHRKASFLMTVNDFRNSTMHMALKTGSGERKLMANILLASQRALRVEGLAFLPGEDDIVVKPDGKYINQWRGFAVEPWKGDVSSDDVHTYLQYVRTIVASNDEETYSWVMAWVADLFQHPGDKCGTALVLVGKPGSGKSVFGVVLRSIIGSNHSSQTNAIESLTGTFNSDSANMLLVHCDEAHNSRRRADALKLKSMITDKTRRIEPKNVNAYEVEDHTRYLFTSNELNEAVAIVDGQDDRRYTVIHINEAYCSSSQELTDATKARYWSEFYAWVADETNLSKLLKFMLNYQYDRARVRKPLDTAARRRVQQHSQRGFDDWLMALVFYEHPLENLMEKDQKTEESYIFIKGKFYPTISDWPHYISYRRLEESYDLYKRRKHAQGMPTFNAQQIKQEFISRGLLKADADTKRVNHIAEVWIRGETHAVEKKIRVTQFPPKDKIVKFLKEKFGFEVDVSEHVEVEYEKPKVSY